MRVTFPYDIVERAILDNLLHLAMDDQHFSHDADTVVLEHALLAAKRELAKAEHLQQVAYSLVEEDSVDSLAKEKYRERRAEVANAKQGLQRCSEELAKALGRTSPREHVARVAEVRQLMTAADPNQRFDAKRRVKLALNDLLKVVQFSGRKKRFTVSLIGGVRVLSFDLSGGQGVDIDWLDFECFAPDPNSVAAKALVIAAYARRKTESETVL